MKDEIIKKENLQIINTNDKGFYEEVLNILRSARQQAYASTKMIMTKAYWDVGERIVKQEQMGEKRAKYGTYLIKNLSIELTDEFGKGFSVANLKNCRQLYVIFPQNSIGYTLCSQLSWSHLKHIMRIGSENERIFYLQESISENWGVRELERNIKTGYYKRILSTQIHDKKDNNLAFVKDPYMLEFMGLPEDNSYLEADLESAVISHLQKFLLEMGKGFSFVARQMRIGTETKDFFLDLVFYNYILKCFVVVDLKTTKLSHQDIGQMDMYVRMFDDLKRREDDNPTIGIIFCTDRDETIVKYSVLNDNRQIFASKYMTVLPTEEELQAELERNQIMYEERTLNV